MKIENHYKRVNEIKNDGLRMEYLRITIALAMAEDLNAFKREYERWLDNIYKDGVKRHEQV